MLPWGIPLSTDVKYEYPELTRTCWVLTSKQKKQKKPFSCWLTGHGTWKGWTSYPSLQPTAPERWDLTVAVTGHQDSPQLCTTNNHQQTSGSECQCERWMADRWYITKTSVAPEQYLVELPTKHIPQKIWFHPLALTGLPIWEMIQTIFSKLSLTP